MKLEEKEKIIFKVHPHWLYVAIPELTLISLAFLILRFTYLLPPWTLMIFAGALLLSMLVIFLDWICINYYLTSLRVIEERGIIGKKVMSIWLDKVQDVTCKFGVVGRILSFGDIDVESAGTYGKIVFSFAPSPRKLQKEIQKAILEFKANKSNMERKEPK